MRSTGLSAVNELLSLYSLLPTDKQQMIDHETNRILANVRWIPQVGPQTEAYFCLADELLYGGAAGGGKSDLLLGVAINVAQSTTIFRAAYKDLKDLELRSQKILGTKDGYNGSDKLWQLGNERIISFGALGQPGSELDWQGRRRAFMGFDEAALLPKSRVQYVMGWAAGRVIYATNPPLSAEGEWLIVWFAPWLDPFFKDPAKPGELRWFINNKEGDPIWVKGPGEYDRGDGEMSIAKSRTFIPSLLKDNAYLTQDDKYQKTIDSLPEPMRSALKFGNFMAARVDHAYQIVPAEWIRQAQARWTPEGRKRPMQCVGVDVAQGGKAKLAIAPMHVGNWFDEVKTVPGVDVKDGPAVKGHVITHTQDGAPIAVDCTGGWGGDAATQLKQAHQDVIKIVYSEKTGACDPDSKIVYKNLRAEMLWEMRRALNPKSGENIALPPGSKILAQGSAARWALKGGEIQAEMKEDIEKRLGSTPDEWDAIMEAWYIRGRGIGRMRRGEPSKWAQQGQGPQPTDGDPFAVDGF